MTAEGAMETDSQGPLGSSNDAASWLERYGNALYRYARTRVGGRELAEDLVQETFLAAIQSQGRFRNQSSVRTWLFSILRHKIIDHYRRGEAGQAVTASESDTPAADHGSHRFFTSDGHWLYAPSRWKSPEEALEDGEFWNVLDGCLGHLPRPLAEAFVLRELEEVESERLCEILGLSPGNLRVRLHRARLLLRNCLENRWFRTGSDDAPRTP